MTVTTKRPSLLLPNVRDPQTEASWKSLKAVLDYMNSQMSGAGTGVASDTNVASLQSQVAALQTAVAALQAQSQTPATPTNPSTPATPSTPPSAAVTANQYIASATIVAGQAVYCPSPGYIVPADYSDLGQATSLVGLAATSGTVGAKVTVSFPGQFAPNSSGLPDGAAYLGANGTLLDSPPAAPLVTAFVGYVVGNSVLVQLNGPQQVYLNDTPAIDYPAISYAAVQGYPSLTQMQVNE